jgi:hypothetical protein
MANVIIQNAFGPLPRISNGLPVPIWFKNTKPKSPLRFKANLAI